MNLKGKKVVVLGLGVSGEAAAELLLKKRAKICVLDDHQTLILKKRSRSLRRKGALVELGENAQAPAEGFDLLVLSPGIPSSHRLVKQAKRKKIPIIGEIELFFQFLNSHLIAVTGTNGKSTTVTLISEMLKRDGVMCALGGNIGLPLSRLVMGKGSQPLIVAEVSSFQLEHIKDFRPNTGVFLNLSPDHLDRYPDLLSYRKAKLRLFRNQNGDNRAVLPANASPWLLKSIPHRVQKVYWNGKRGTVFRQGQWLRAKEAGRASTICGVKEAALVGPHNLQNIMAAATTALLEGVSRQAIRETIVNFKGLPHRLEYVLQKAEVDFYNDSKATNPGAVKVALRSFRRPIIWIAGGSDKGFDFRVLKPIIHRKVKLAIFIGDTRSRLKKDLQTVARNRLAGSLEEAVYLAYRQAEPRDVVLLSPACASFDMFKNYQQRGETFKSIVRSLPR